MRKEVPLNQPDLKVIISGGGTGGHLFPALAIAEAIKNLRPQAEIRFVGALGKIEMEKVPAAGYQIEGLDIRGLQRSLSLENLKFPIRLYKSVQRSKTILKEFKPDVAVGVGGYASGPLLYAAEKRAIPCLVQEQNSYPGITNKILGKKADVICVAYEGMEDFFPADRIMLTGNPVRQAIVDMNVSREEALKTFGLSTEYPVVLVIGGSLGARTINQSILNGLPAFEKEKIQLIWQTGKSYYKGVMEQADTTWEGIRIMEFISGMELAYAAADVIVSRAGAGTISELAYVGKPVILVPSPNVAEDHQTKNAQALVKKDAAVLVPDVNAASLLVRTAIDLVHEESVRLELSKNIKSQAYPDSALKIAQEIIRLSQIKKIL